MNVIYLFYLNIYLHGIILILITLTFMSNSKTQTEYRANKHQAPSTIVVVPGKVLRRYRSTVELFKIKRTAIA